MREFNTSGVCYPELHYFVSRREILEKTLAQIKGKPGFEASGRYFTLYAPRQTGKSTLVAEIQRHLEDEYLCLDLSFEGKIGLTEAEFAAALAQDFQWELPLKGITLPASFTCRKIFDLRNCFVLLKKLTSKKLVLVIDEFDSLTEDYLGKLLHLFREIYPKRGRIYNLHALLLIGVRNLTGVSLEHASPFNIADEIRLSRFTRAEVEELIGQYEAETGQHFAPAVKERIYEETQGQPGLVNEICKLLVERFNPVDYNQLQKGEIAAPPLPLEMPAFTRMLDYFISAHISKNVSNILNKARADETQVLRLFDTTAKVPYKIDEPWQKHLWVNGVVDFEEEPGSARKYVKFTCPLYQKKLYAFFKPTLEILPEQKYYLRPGEDYHRYLREDGPLDLLGVLQNYQRYLDRRGAKAFAFARGRADGTRLEAVYHYSLDCYLASIAQMFQGRTEVEFPTGNGKVDIFLHLGTTRSVIEIKNYTNEYQLAMAKLQAARYARSEGLSEAYLVIFRETEETSVPGPFVEKCEEITLYGIFIRVGRT